MAMLLSGSLHSADDAWLARLQPTSDAWKRSKQELVFHNESEPKTLDPAIMTGVLESRLVMALFEGLVTNDPQTLEPRPGLASHWRISDDRLTYTFHLRPAARWSDGHPLTAGDVARAWRRVLAEPQADYAYQLFPIAGAEDFRAGRLTDSAQVGIAAPDERTLVVRLHQPCSWFLHLVAFHTLMPTPVDVVAAHGDRWVRPEHIVGNGPFILTEWEPRERIVMVRNPHYWDRDRVRLEKITAKPTEDIETAWKLYQDGQLDWMHGVPNTKIDEIRRHGDYYVNPYLGTYFYRFNCSRPPFDDPAVRRAFCMAIDRKAITDFVTRAGQRPSSSFVPPMAGYVPVPGLEYDKAKARALLASRGYGPQKPFPLIDLQFNTSDNHKQIAEAVAQQLKDNLGVAVSLRNSEWKVYLDDQERLNFQLSRSAWIGDYPDPNTFLDLFATDGGNNRTGWSSAEYDRLLKASQAEGDPVKRNQSLSAMERILVVDQCPILPLYTYVSQGLVREKVRGMWDNIIDHHPPKYLWIEE